MNQADQKLSEALRELAAASPQDAPAELGAAMKTAFARHHARRQRRNQIAWVSGVAACLLLSLAWLGARKQAQPKIAARQTTQPERAVTSASPAEANAHHALVAKPSNDTTIAKHAKLSPVGPRGRQQRGAPEQPRVASHAPAINRAEGPTVATSSDFVALPMFDPAVPIGPSRMVRIDMPGSDLQLMGYPVNEQLLERRVVTDVLVGQDGMPYAVRLVQTRSDH